MSDVLEAPALSAHVDPDDHLVTMMALGGEGVLPTLRKMLEYFPAGYNLLSISFAGMIPVGIEQQRESASQIITPQTSPVAGVMVGMRPQFLIVASAPSPRGNPRDDATH